MPFKEAMFWVSVTVFGTGLYFVIGGTNLLAAIPLAVLGLAGVIFTVYRYYHPEFKKPPAWGMLLVLTWAFLVYVIAANRSGYPMATFAVSVNPINATSAFVADHQVKLNAHLQNVFVNVLMRDVKWAGVLQTATLGIASEDALWNDFSKSEGNFDRDLAVADVLPMNDTWATLTTHNVLNADDVQELKKGGKVLYVLIKAEYADPNGKHQMEFCQSLQPPGDMPFVWHNCVHHNHTK